MTKFRRDVDDASEYRKVVKHANEIGFEPVKHNCFGTWETKNGEPCWPTYTEVRNVGYKYFTILMDGEYYETIPSDRDAKMTITFED